MRYARLRVLGNSGGATKPSRRQSGQRRFERLARIISDVRAGSSVELRFVGDALHAKANQMSNGVMLNLRGDCGASREAQGFCHSVGPPLCLADLDLVAPTREEIQRVAEAAVAEE